MPSPRSRLLWLTGVVLIPAAMAVAAAPQVEVLFLLALVGLAVVAVGDWVLSASLLGGVKVTCGTPVRLTKDLPGQIDLRVRDGRFGERPLRLALALPPEFQCPEEFVSFRMSASALADAANAARQDNGKSHHAKDKKDAQPWWIVSWKCTPLRRGNFTLDFAYFERSSLLGLWAIRRRVTVRPLNATGDGEAPAGRVTEIRVYPNLMSERKNVSALFLYRGDYGSHVQRTVGKGREFEKLREYVPGDGYDELHWKATARRGRPITKVFQVERTQEVYVLIDASRLSAREFQLTAGGPQFLAAEDAAGGATSATPPGAGVTPAAGTAGPAASGPVAPGSLPQAVTALERYLTASLVMAMAAQRQGDLFGVVAFSNTIDSFVRSRGGQQHYRTCRDSLYTLQPRMVSPDFGEVFSFIRLHLRRRALLVILTSLDDPILAESFARNVGLVSRQHLVLVNQLRTPMTAPLFADENVASVRDVYSRLAGHLQWQRLRELEKALKRQGVSYAQMESPTLCAQLVSQYMNVKRRQIL